VALACMLLLQHTNLSHGNLESKHCWYTGCVVSGALTHFRMVFLDSPVRLAI
jgi:hypothetical protein